MRKKLALAISVAVLAGVVISVSIYSFGRADTNTVDWFSGPPSFAKAADYAVAPPIINVDGCTQTNVLVKRGFDEAYENSCLTPTAMGPMKQIYYTEGVVQPQGNGKAYPISFVAGGNPIVIPVRNQASGLYLTGNSNGLGVFLGLYRQISNHLSLSVSLSGISYNVSQQAPDLVFRYPEGQSLWFNTNARSFSENGRYFMADSAAGFVRINLSTLAIQPFAPSLPLINNFALTSANTAIDDDGKMAAIAYNAPGGWGSPYFKLVDVNSCPDPMPANPNVQPKFNCRTVDMLPQLKQAVPTLDTVYNVRFMNDATLTFTVAYRDALGALKYADYSMTANGQVLRVKQYLALGDSYISGEGAFSYRDGTDTKRNQCHQSLVSYPYLLGSKQGSFASLACSGARTRNIARVGSEKPSQLVNYNPTNEENEAALTTHQPGYVHQNEFVLQDNPEAITISIGGNDIGFGQILEKCVHPLKNLSDNFHSHFTCYNSYEDRAEVVNTINSQFARLRSLYESMRNSGTGVRRVYVIGYPQVAKVDGDCGVNVQMNATEIRFAHDLISYLDGVIKRAADEAGVQYVNTEQAFDGHRLCEATAGQSAMNGFTISSNANGGRDFKASFHPNQLGHRLLASVIADQTLDLTKPMPAPVTKTNQINFDPNLTILQNMTKTGRPIKQVRQADELVGKVKPRASSMQFVVDAVDYLAKAAAQYTVSIDSGSASQTLASVTADAAGNINVNTAVPADASTGFQTLHITGNDVFGNPLDIQQSFFVSDSSGDSDGDGVPDTTDSCVLATQSGVDADQDGIDDACDPSIDLPPPPPPPADAGIIWWDNAVLPITIEAISGP